MADTGKDDAGYTSRKLLFSLYTSVVVAALGLAAARWPGIQTVYPAVVGGLLGCLTIYLGGNVASLHLNNRMATAIATNTPEGGNDNPNNVTIKNSSSDTEISKTGTSKAPDGQTSDEDRGSTEEDYIGC